MATVLSSQVVRADESESIKMAESIEPAMCILVADSILVADPKQDEFIPRARKSQSIYSEEEIAEHKLNRGLVMLDNPFVPKDQWVVGLTGSYSTHVNDNYSFTIIEGINSNGYTFKISPMLSYTFADNMAAGLRFEYGRSLLKIDTAGLSFGSGDSSIDIELVNFYALQHSYTGMAVFRQYIPLGYAKRFAFFSEIRLEAGGSQSKFAYDSPVQGSFAKSYNLGLGIVPGIVAFATNNVAFEVTVGMMGIGFSHTEQIHNQVYVGEANSSSMNFKINPLSIGLGVAFYM